MLVEEHKELPAQPDNENIYSFGSMGPHNVVVVACPPSGMSANHSAATVAKDMTRSYKSIRFGLTFGIGSAN